MICSKHPNIFSKHHQTDCQNIFFLINHLRPTIKNKVKIKFTLIFVHLVLTLDSGSSGLCWHSPAGTPGEASGWLCPAPRGGTSWRGEPLDHISIYINIHKIIHVLLTVHLLNGCSFAFATWWRRTSQLTWWGYVLDPQWPSLSRQGHGRGSVTSCVQYCTTWEAMCSMKTATGRPRPRRRSRVRRPCTGRRRSTTQLQVT